VSVFPLVLVLAQAAAWSSGRPPECGGEDARAANVWERAKAPELRRYCDLVAGAASKLAGTAPMPREAIKAAQDAEKVLPGHAAPRILEGRALAASGQLDDALKALTEGKARDARSLDDPLALLAWARVNARTGHGDEASDAYRALLPRASALPAGDRASASIEAGLIASVRGQSALDDAVAALREGAKDAQDDAQPVAVLALALALDRRGDADEAHALLSERAHGDPRTPLGTARAKEVLAVAPNEALAMQAVALEATDPAGAKDAWQKYIDAAPQGPWAAHAKAHLASLGGKRPAVRRPK
jgi:tetratricopeptide (TPR) repeat protein